MAFLSSKDLQFHSHTLSSQTLHSSFFQDQDTSKYLFFTHSTTPHFTPLHKVLCHIFQTHFHSYLPILLCHLLLSDNLIPHYTVLTGVPYICIFKSIIIKLTFNPFVTIQIIHQKHWISMHNSIHSNLQIPSQFPSFQTSFPLPSSLICMFWSSVYLSVILTSLVMVHVRYLARAALYSGVPSFPNLRERSSGRKRTAALDGSMSRKSSSSIRSCMMGWWRAAVRKTCNTEPHV